MARIQDYVMAIDPAAKAEIDKLEDRFNLKVSHATKTSNMAKIKNSFLKDCVDFRKEYQDLNWREPFLKAFKHAEDCNMVNYSS